MVDNNNEDGAAGAGHVGGYTGEISTGIDALNRGGSWGYDTLTYTFASLLNNKGSGENTSNIDYLNVELQTAVTKAFDYIETIIDLTFSNNFSTDASANFIIKEASMGGTKGFSYFPNNVRGTDVYLEKNYDTAGELEAGQDGYRIILHEIGHGLGMDHPHDGSANLPSNYDNQNSTIMSYKGSSAGSVGGDAAEIGGGEAPSTYQIFDIATLQNYYGANSTYNSGATIYNYAGDSFVGTIWDGGGIDEISADGTSNDVIIDLREGVANITKIDDTMVWNAYGANIENATGGSGNDTIIGNDLDNILAGGSGSDSLTGGVGDDTLNGGTGTDTALFSGNSGDYALTDENAISGDDGNDTLTDIEILEFDDGTFQWDNDSTSWIATEIETITDSDPEDTINEINDVTENSSGKGSSSGESSSVGSTGGSTGDGTTTTIGTFTGATDNSAIDFSARGDSNNGTKVVSVVEVNGKSINGNQMILSNDDLTSDTSTGTSLADYLKMGGGDDVARGGNGNDVVKGGGGHDQVYGDGGTDFINGNAGNDKVYGGDGDDKVVGGKDNDLVRGENGNDFINGNNGSDNVYGDEGNDIIHGGKENDNVYGNTGNDFLYGDKGDDNLTGGDGADVFVYNNREAATEMGNDIVIDFSKGEDYIQILGDLTATEILANATVEGNNTVLHFDAYESLTINGITDLGLSDFI